MAAYWGSKTIRRRFDLRTYRVALETVYRGAKQLCRLQLSNEEQLYEMGRKAHAAGWQLATHANGDLAIDRILSVYERLQRELPKKDPRFRIEHCTLATEPLDSPDADVTSHTGSVLLLCVK